MIGRALRQLGSVRGLITVPGALALTLWLSAFIALRLDRMLARSDAVELYRILQTDYETAVTILSTISGASITTLSLVYSLVLVVFTLAAGNIAPRLLRRFTGDRVNQVTAGLLGGTFLFSLTILHQTGPDTVPGVSIAIAFCLAVIAVLQLIFFVHTVSRSVTIDEEIAAMLRVESALARAQAAVGDIPAAAADAIAATAGTLTPAPADLARVEAERMDGGRGGMGDDIEAAELAGIRTRRVAILVADGVDAASLRSPLEEGPLSVRVEASGRNNDPRADDDTSAQVSFTVASDEDRAGRWVRDALIWRGPIILPRLRLIADLAERIAPVIDDDTVAAVLLTGGLWFAADLTRALAREGRNVRFDALWLASYGDEQTSRGRISRPEACDHG